MEVSSNPYLMTLRVKKNHRQGGTMQFKGEVISCGLTMAFAVFTGICVIVFAKDVGERSRGGGGEEKSVNGGGWSSMHQTQFPR